MNPVYGKCIIVIIIFNIIDGILTYAGIHYGFAYEKNPLMIEIMSNPTATFFVKLLIPTLLLLGTYRALSQYHLGKIIPISIITALAIYTLIMINHLYVLMQLVVYLS